MNDMPRYVPFLHARLGPPVESQLCPMAHWVKPLRTTVGDGTKPQRQLKESLWEYP